MLLSRRIGEDKLTDFEKKYVFVEEKDENKQRIRTVTFLVDKRVLEKERTPNNSFFGEADDVALDETDGAEDDPSDETDVALDTEGDDSDGTDDEGSSDVALDDTDDSEASGSDDSGDSDDSNDSSDSNSGGNEVALDDSDDSESSSSDNNGGSDNGDSDDSDDNSEESPEEKEEALHKQALFGKCQTLYKNLSNYIDKLDEVVGTSDQTNHMYKEINDSFKRLRDFLYDYMVIKFKDSSYTESMLFYQRALASINLMLDMLENVRTLESNK